MFVGGENVSTVLLVTRPGLAVGTFVETTTGRAVGVNADTGCGASVPTLLIFGVSFGACVIVVVGNDVAVVLGNFVLVVFGNSVTVVVGCTVVGVTVVVDADGTVLVSVKLNYYKHLLCIYFTCSQGRSIKLK